MTERAPARSEEVEEVEDQAHIAAAHSSTSTSSSSSSSPPPEVGEDAGSHARAHSKTAEQLLQERDDRVATELPELPAVRHRRRRNDDHDGDTNWYLRPALVRARTAEEAEEEEAHRRAGFRYNRYQIVRAPRRWYHPFVGWWSRHVNVKVDVAKRRDHLALERTFLGYLRTSVALSMTGVTISQLFRLQHSVAPSTTFGYYVAGEPLAGCFIAAAIVVVLVGAVRFWRQQNAMVRGKVWAGGWEVNVIMGLSILLCVGLFAVAVGVTIEHDIND